MRYIYAILIYCFLPYAVAAEKAILLKEEDVTQQDTEELNKFLIEQAKKQAVSEEEKKEQQHQEWRLKYPDVVPATRPGKTLGLSQFIYDTDFANTIFFSPGSSFITDVQAEKIDAIIQTMIEEPSFYLVVVGHSALNNQLENADERIYYNRWISGRRAVKVWNYLVNKGIMPTRVASFYKDSQEPLNDEQTIAEKHMNRRVELRLTNQPIPIGSKKSNKASSQPK